MSRLCVEVIGDARGIDAICSQWNDLFDAAPSASPFLSYDWMASWQSTMAGGARPFVLCARDNGRLVGLLPLIEQRVMSAVGPVRRLAFMGESIVAADGLDILVHPESGRAAANAIVARLAEEPFDLLQLDGLSSDSPTLQLLAWHLGNDGARRYTLEPHQVCPYIDLSDGWSAVLARSRRPNQFGRLSRDLARMDGFQFRTITAADEVGPAFDRMLHLHQLRWEVQGGSDALSKPAVQAFHRRLIAALARRGIVRFEELWIDGACRATYYGYRRADHYWLYQTGYDPSWAKKSVAFIRMGSSIREAAESGVRIYDFLRGMETYKFDWATAARITLSIRVVGSRRAARLLAAQQQLRLATEIAAEAVFPKRSLDVLRRLRRARDRYQPIAGGPAGPREPRSSGMRAFEASGEGVR